MAPRVSAPLRCSNCGWKTQRRLERANKPCAKCGGRLVLDAPEEDQVAVIAIVVFALLFMAAAGIILGNWS